VQANHTPLNEVFEELHLQYGAQFSFNSDLLSRCYVSSAASYASMQEAVEALLKPCNFTYELKGDVFVIYETERVDDQSEATPFTLSAEVLSVKNGEPLPFTTLQINGNGMVSDVNGRFAFKSADSVLQIRISYVGYLPMDTIVRAQGNYRFRLEPSIHRLAEVSIVPNARGTKAVTIDKAQSVSLSQNTHVPPQPGVTKLNHQVAVFQPGSSDNTLFNLLRLQPGILAAGEQTKDFIIAGAYKGQSQIKYDGITLFNLSSYNDHIGAVNPLMVKEVQVSEMGYGVDDGDRVGGLVNITGTSGDIEAVHGVLKFNNQTLATRVSVPILRSSALQLAFRQTYYHWYDGFNSNYLYSDLVYHRFRDFNLKYSGALRKGTTYGLSFITFGDQNKLVYSDNASGKSYSGISLYQSEQMGGSFNLGHTWRNGAITNTVLSSSKLLGDDSHSWKFVDRRTNRKYVSKGFNQNQIAEHSIKFEHILPSTPRHSTKLGGGWVYNNSVDSNSAFYTPGYEASAMRVYAYLTDQLRIFKALSLLPGLRTTYLMEANSWYWEPRLAALITFNESLQAKLSWGIYRQFVSNLPYIDEVGNYSFNWVANNSSDFEIPLSRHQSLSIGYEKNGYFITAQAFYRVSSNLNQVRMFGDDVIRRKVLTDGEALAYGLQSQVQKSGGWYTLGLAHTWSKSSEYFSFFRDDEFKNAPHDQRHELKARGLVHLGPFSISANYVYGTGFYLNERVNNWPYKRLDVAAMYSFAKRKVGFEAGASVINVLNTKNLRTSYFSVFQDGKSSIQQATPFMPTVFVNISF